MLSESEFNLLSHFLNNAFLRREDFPSDKEFDAACERALKLFRLGILRSESTKPYRRNMTGSWPRYLILGAFYLSSEAEDVLDHKDYRSYIKGNSRHQWTLGNKLAGLSLLVAVFGLIINFLFG